MYTCKPYSKCTKGSDIWISWLFFHYLLLHSPLVHSCLVHVMHILNHVEMKCTRIHSNEHILKNKWNFWNRLLPPLLLWEINIFGVYGNFFHACVIIKSSLTQFQPWESIAILAGPFSNINSNKNKDFVFSNFKQFGKLVSSGKGSIWLLCD